MTLEEWRAKGIGKAGHDPSLWLLAEDEQGIVGAALGERWENGTGYVAELAVARAGARPRPRARAPARRCSPRSGAPGSRTPS